MLPGLAKIRAIGGAAKKISGILQIANYRVTGFCRPGTRPSIYNQIFEG
jgi:hypothetical protein